MKKTLWDLVVKVRMDNIGAYAAQAALFFIMSLIPYMMILLSLVRYTPVTENMILAWTRQFAPVTICDLLLKIVREVYHNSLGTMFFSILFAVFSSAKTIHSLQYSLNIIYQTHETRNWLVLRLWAIVETILILAAMLLMMVISVFGKKIQLLILDKLPQAAIVPELFLKYRYVLLFFILIVVLTWIYKVLPNRKTSFRSQLAGGICCTIAWYIFSIGVSVYVNVFHGFSLYGSLTAIVLIMFWMYFAMYIFLVCGEINDSFELLWLEYRVIRKKKADRRMFGLD